MNPTGLRPLDILAVGGVDVDLVLSVEALPDHGQKVMGRLIGRMPGGTVANFACAAARLGQRVASLATVGDDEAGRMVIADFERFGVQSHLVEVRPEVETHFTVIMIEPSGERSIVVVPMYSERHDPETVRRAVAVARAVYTMPHDPELFRVLGAVAREAGTRVMIDVERTIGADRAALERMLGDVTIASFNEAGLVAASGESPTVEGARRLLAYGPDLVLVTLGSQGALAVWPGGHAQVGGHRVEVRDTTGAGDTFNAAFLSATLDGHPPTEALRRANAAAAIAVTALGPRGHLPTPNEVERFLRESVPDEVDDG